MQAVSEELVNESKCFQKSSNEINKNKRVRAQAVTQCMRICTELPRGILHALGQKWRADIEYHGSLARMLFLLPSAADFCSLAYCCVSHVKSSRITLKTAQQSRTHPKALEAPTRSLTSISNGGLRYD
jgi:hypothetical protein